MSSSATNTPFRGRPKATARYVKYLVPTMGDGAVAATNSTDGPPQLVTSPLVGQPNPHISNQHHHPLSGNAAVGTPLAGTGSGSLSTLSSPPPAPVLAATTTTTATAGGGSSQHAHHQPVSHAQTSVHSSCLAPLSGDGGVGGSSSVLLGGGVGAAAVLGGSSLGLAGGGGGIAGVGGGLGAASATTTIAATSSQREQQKLVKLYIQSQKAAAAAAAPPPTPPPLPSVPIAVVVKPLSGGGGAVGGTPLAIASPHLNNPLANSHVTTTAVNGPPLIFAPRMPAAAGGELASDVNSTTNNSALMHSSGNTTVCSPTSITSVGALRLSPIFSAPPAFPSAVIVPTAARPPPPASLFDAAISSPTGTGTPGTARTPTDESEGLEERCGSGGGEGLLPIPRSTVSAEAPAPFGSTAPAHDESFGVLRADDPLGGSNVSSPNAKQQQRRLLPPWRKSHQGSVASALNEISNGLDDSSTAATAGGETAGTIATPAPPPPPPSAAGPAVVLTALSQQHSGNTSANMAWLVQSTSSQHQQQLASGSGLNNTGAAAAAAGVGSSSNVAGGGGGGKAFKPTAAAAYQKGMRDLAWRHKSKDIRQSTPLHQILVDDDDDDEEGGGANDFYGGLGSRDPSPTTAYINRRLSREEASSASASAGLGVPKRSFRTSAGRRGAHHRQHNAISVEGGMSVPAVAVQTRNVTIGTDGTFRVGELQYGASEGSSLMARVPNLGGAAAPAAATVSSTSPTASPHRGHHSVSPPPAPTPFNTSALLPTTVLPIAQQPNFATNNANAIVAAAVASSSSATTVSAPTAPNAKPPAVYKQVAHRGNKYRKMLSEAMTAAADETVRKRRKRLQQNRGGSLPTTTTAGNSYGGDTNFNTTSSYNSPNNGMLAAPPHQQQRLLHASSAVNNYGSFNDGRFPQNQQQQQPNQQYPHQHYHHHHHAVVGMRGVDTDSKAKEQSRRYTVKILANRNLFSPLFTTSHGTTFNLPPVSKSQLPSVVGGAGAVRHKGTSLFSTHLPPPRLVTHHALPMAPRGAIYKASTTTSKQQFQQQQQHVPIEATDGSQQQPQPPLMPPSSYSLPPFDPLQPLYFDPEQSLYYQYCYVQPPGQEEGAEMVLVAVPVSTDGLSLQTQQINPSSHDDSQGGDGGGGANSNVMYLVPSDPCDVCNGNNTNSTNNQSGRRLSIVAGSQNASLVRNDSDEEEEEEEDEEDDDEYEVISYTDGAADLMNFVVPTAVNYALSTLLLIVPIGFAGNRLGPHGIAATAAGLLFVQIFVIYPLQGLFFATETLCSHVYGNDSNSNVIGLLFQRGLALCLVGYGMLQCLLLYTAEHIINLCFDRHTLYPLGAQYYDDGAPISVTAGSITNSGGDPIASHPIQYSTMAHAVGVVVSMMPLFLFCTVVSTVLSKFLSAQMMLSAPLVGTLAGLLVAVLWQSAFAERGLWWVAVGTGVAALTQLLAMLALCFGNAANKAQLARTMGRRRLREALQLTDVKDFLQLALPSSAFIALEAAAYDVTILVAVSMGTAIGSAWAALMAYEYLLTFAAAGLSAGACAKVGAAIGANQPVNAKTYAWTALGLAVGWGVIVILPLFTIFSRELIGAMGGDWAEASNVIRVYPTLLLLDFFESTCQGIFSGAASNHLGAPLFAVAMWGFGLPLALCLSSGAVIRIANFFNGHGFVLHVMPPKTLEAYQREEAEKKKSDEKSKRKESTAAAAVGQPNAKKGHATVLAQKKKAPAVTPTAAAAGTQPTPLPTAPRSVDESVEDGGSSDEEVLRNLYYLNNPYLPAAYFAGGVGTSQQHQLPMPTYPVHVVKQYVKDNTHGPLVSLFEPMVGIAGLGVGFTAGLLVLCVLLVRALNSMDWVGIAFRSQVEDEDDEEDEEDEEEEEEEEMEEEEEEEEEEEDPECEH